MIIAGSRYKESLDFNQDGLVKVAVKKEVFVSKRTTTIITRSGDTFDKVASRVLGDSTQYWKIAGLNPSIRFPDEIPAGTILIVPVV